MPVPQLSNPALEQFAAAIGQEFVLAQVLISRTESGFELRHIEDRDAASSALSELPVHALRELAQKTASGAFRPLKSAPNLRRRWRAVASGVQQLGEALHHLYPGAVADWAVVRSGPAPVTHYRPFTERQTGMYRITTKLSDVEAAQVTRACCHVRFCLKQRLWTVGQLPPDASPPKSAIPCLEPCAVMLEFARTAVRLEQDDKKQQPYRDIDALQVALERAAQSGNVREADFAAPENPRRIQLLIEKLETAAGPNKS